MTNNIYKYLQYEWCGVNGVYSQRVGDVITPRPVSMQLYKLTYELQ